jgi:hypothetical protein
MSATPVAHALPECAAVVAEMDQSAPPPSDPPGPPKYKEWIEAVEAIQKSVYQRRLGWQEICPAKCKSLPELWWESPEEWFSQSNSFRIMSGTILMMAEAFNVKELVCGDEGWYQHLSQKIPRIEFSLRKKLLAADSADQQDAAKADVEEDPIGVRGRWNMYYTLCNILVDLCIDRHLHATSALKGLAKTKSKWENKKLSLNKVVGRDFSAGDDFGFAEYTSFIVYIMMAISTCVEDFIERLQRDIVQDSDSEDESEPPALNGSQASDDEQASSSATNSAAERRAPGFALVCGGDGEGECEKLEIFQGGHTHSFDLTDLDYDDRVQFCADMVQKFGASQCPKGYELRSAKAKDGSSPDSHSIAKAINQRLCDNPVRNPGKTSAAMPADEAAAPAAPVKKPRIVERECTLTDSNPIKAMKDDDPLMFEMMIQGLLVFLQQSEKDRRFNPDHIKIRYERAELKVRADPSATVKERANKFTVHHCPPDSDAEELLDSSLECHVKLTAWISSADCLDERQWTKSGELLNFESIIAATKTYQEKLHEHGRDFYGMTYEMPINPVALAVACSALKCFNEAVRALTAAPLDALMRLEQERCDGDCERRMDGQPQQLSMLRLVPSLQFAFSQMLVMRWCDLDGDFPVETWSAGLDDFHWLHQAVQDLKIDPTNWLSYDDLVEKYKKKARRCHSAELAPGRVLLTAAFHTLNDPPQFIRFLTGIIKRKHPDADLLEVGDAAFLKAEPIKQVCKFLVGADFCVRGVLNGKTSKDGPPFSESVLCAGTFLSADLVHTWFSSEHTWDSEENPVVEGIAQAWRKLRGHSEAQMTCIRHDPWGAEFLEFVQYGVRAKLYRILLFCFQVFTEAVVMNGLAGKAVDGAFKNVASAIAMLVSDEDGKTPGYVTRTIAWHSGIKVNLTHVRDMWEPTSISLFDPAPSLMERNHAVRLLWWMFREYFSLIDLSHELPPGLDSSVHFLKILEGLDRLVLCRENVCLTMTAPEVFWEVEKAFGDPSVTELKAQWLLLSSHHSALMRARMEPWADKLMTACKMPSIEKAREAKRITDELAQRLLDEEQAEAARKAEEEARRVADRAASKQARKDAEEARRAKAQQSAEEKAEAERKRAEQAQHAKWLEEWTTRIEAGLKHGQTNFEEYRSMPEGKARVSKRNGHWSRYTQWKKLTREQREELAEVLGEAVSRFVEMYERHEREEKPQAQRKHEDPEAVAKKLAEQQAARERAEKAEKAEQAKKDAEERLARERAEKATRKKAERAARKAEQERAEQERLQQLERERAEREKQERAEREHREELERKRMETEAREAAAREAAFGKGRGGRGGRGGGRGRGGKAPPAAASAAASAAPPEVAPGEDTNTCIVCMDAVRSHIAIACGHFLYCAVCSEKMKGTCAQCQKPTSFVKVFQ